MSAPNTRRRAARLRVSRTRTWFHERLSLRPRRILGRPTWLRRSRRQRAATPPAGGLRHALCRESFFSTPPAPCSGWTRGPHCTRPVAPDRAGRPAGLPRMPGIPSPGSGTRSPPAAGAARPRTPAVSAADAAGHRPGRARSSRTPPGRTPPCHPACRTASAWKTARRAACRAAAGPAAQRPVLRLLGIRAIGGGGLDDVEESLAQQPLEVPRPRAASASICASRAASCAAASSSRSAAACRSRALPASSSLPAHSAIRPGQTGI